MCMQQLCVEVSQIQGDFSFSLQHSTPIYVDIVRSLPRIPDPGREHQTSPPQRSSAAGPGPVLNAAIMYFFFPICQRHCVCVSSMLSSSQQQITQILHRQLCRDVFFDVLTEVTKPLTKDIFGFVTFHFQQNKSHFYRLELDLRKLSDKNFFRILLIRVFCDCNCPLGPFCPLLFLPSFDFFLKSSGLVSKICDRSLSST